jgi:uncharacterized protein
MGDTVRVRATAFAGTERIASGDLAEVATAAKRLLEAGDSRILLVFDDVTAEQVELDLRGSVDDVRARYETNAPSATASDSSEVVTHRSPGRPKLGVVGREVTLLPRHWEWLSAQPGGASIALRRLVEQARSASEPLDRVRRSQEVAHRFMTAMAGNEPGFEEALRALFASEYERFETCIAGWPADVRDFARSLAAASFAYEPS